MEKPGIEVEGRTVAEALKKALVALKASKDQVTVQILCEEEKGLFGMPGAKQAKIRVLLK
jgi:spoIIIJ-associated protein